MSEEKRGRYGEGREALLRATVEIVATYGLHGLTFRRVAEHVGVNNTLISYHFGTKDKLISAAVEWASERAIVLSDLGRFAHTEAFARRLVELVAEEPQLQLFQYEFILESHRRPELRPAVHRLYDGYIDALTDAVSELGYPEPRDLARAVFAALDGLVWQQLLVTDRDSAERAIERITSLLDEGARP